ncbi:MAG: hypothetical protein HYZ28_04645 [Myxococcales bacterium]|nr:hypothetical protein [Myxococcales bacterium]
MRVVGPLLQRVFVPLEEKMKLRLLPTLILLSFACGVVPELPAEPAALRQELAGCQTFVDADKDGIDDGDEQCLLDRHAPVVYLPRSLDWTLPASVNWLMPRVVMRFHHSSAPDCGVLSQGYVNQYSLVSQSHRKKCWSLWKGYHHCDPTYYSSSGPWNEDQTFFLQHPNDATHSGSSYPSDWIVYGHVYRNTLGGFNAQYWFFFAYNDGPSGFNHEGDWESITVRLRADQTVDGVYFCQHGDCSTFRSPAAMSWYGGTHPYVWTADGTHASYPDESSCDGTWREGFDNSCETVSSYRWFTWSGGQAGQYGYQGGGVINVGEKGLPLNGQQFVKYYARWGEIGNSGDTSGPRTPTYQSTWDLDRGSASSCAGKCGGYAGSCWCDYACVSYGDCCSDACSACGAC